MPFRLGAHRSHAHVLAASQYPGADDATCAFSVRVGVEGGLVGGILSVAVTLVTAATESPASSS